MSWVYGVVESLRKTWSWICETFQELISMSVHVHSYFVSCQWRSIVVLVYVMNASLLYLAELMLYSTAC